MTTWWLYQYSFKTKERRVKRLSHLLVGVRRGKYESICLTVSWSELISWSRSRWNLESINNGALPVITGHGFLVYKSLFMALFALGPCSVWVSENEWKWKLRMQILTQLKLIAMPNAFWLLRPQIHTCSVPKAQNLGKWSLVSPPWEPTSALLFARMWLSGPIDSGVGMRWYGGNLCPGITFQNPKPPSWNNHEITWCID